MTRKKLAFTLAEVLITLSIVGIVAAMVVPAITNYTNNREIVVKVKKAMSIFDGAFKMMKVNGVDITTADTSDSNLFNAFVPYLSIVKNCGAGQGCWPTNVMYKHLDKTNWTIVDGNYATAIVNDGMLIAVWRNPSSSICNVDYGTGPLHNSGCGTINIDINGVQGPNQVGRDVFVLLITQNGIFPLGSNYDQTLDKCTGLGWGCSTKVLQDNAVNY